MTDRERIIDRLVKLCFSIDEKDWKGVEACFADTVFFDTTSMSGGQPQKLSPSSISAGWRDALERIEQIHHQLGNFAVERSRDEADVSCYGIAWHYRQVPSGRTTRTFVGTYDFHLTREVDEWLIDLFRFNLKFIDGNTDLDRE